jgi:hypothetical protein
LRFGRSGGVVTLSREPRNLASTYSYIRAKLVTVMMTTMTREITSTEAGMAEEAQTAFEMILGMALPPVPSLEYVKERETAWKER